MKIKGGCACESKRKPGRGKSILEVNPEARILLKEVAFLYVNFTFHLRIADNCRVSYRIKIVSAFHRFYHKVLSEMCG